MNDAPSAAKPFRSAEDVYLNEDRYEEPKEIFKFLGDLVGELALPENARVLDAGCATGELLYYFRRLFPGIEGLGFDVSKEMIEQAQQRVAGFEFRVGSLLDSVLFCDRLYDLVTCCAVMPYFDDPGPPLKNLLSAVKPGGAVILLNPVNEDPIDTRLLYRSADAEEGPWLPDCTFSKRSYEKILERSGYDIEHSWRPFRMPFALPKQKDLIRAWTFESAENPHQLVSGTQQLIDLQALVMRVRAVPA